MVLRSTPSNPLQSYHALHAPTFDAVVRAHSREVVDLARLFGAPERETEDVAQEVFIALYRAIRERRFTFDMPPGPWLWRTTFLITCDHVRALRRTGFPIELQGELEPMDGQADAERRAQVSQLRDLLQELLDGLHPDLRAVFVLHEVKELSLPVIAEMLEIKVTTAQWRLVQAHAHFDAALRRRRAADLRKYGTAAAILPLSADAILRLVRTLPPPEVSPDVAERILARVKREIGLDAAAPQRPKRPRRLRPRPSGAPRTESLIITGLAFVVGIMAGAIGLDLLARPAPPLPQREPPILAVVPPIDDSIWANPPDPVPDNTSAANTPVPRSAPVDAEGEAERLCLQNARALLAARGNAREALAELARCEQRFPQTQFPAVRDKLRRDVEAALHRMLL